MQEKIKSNGNLVKQELKERDMVETQINSVKSWVRETKEYLENPTIDIDAQLKELKVKKNIVRPISSLPCFYSISGGYLPGTLRGIRGHTWSTSSVLSALGLRDFEGKGSHTMLGIKLRAWSKQCNYLDF